MENLSLNECFDDYCHHHNSNCYVSLNDVIQLYDMNKTTHDKLEQIVKDLQTKRNSCMFKCNMYTKFYIDDMLNVITTINSLLM